MGYRLNGPANPQEEEIHNYCVGLGLRSSGAVRDLLYVLDNKGSAPERRSVLENLAVEFIGVGGFPTLNSYVEVEVVNGALKYSCGGLKKPAEVGRLVKKILDTSRTSSDRLIDAERALDFFRKLSRECLKRGDNPYVGVPEGLRNL